RRSPLPATETSRIAMLSPLPATKVPWRGSQTGQAENVTRRDVATACLSPSPGGMKVGSLLGQRLAPWRLVGGLVAEVPDSGEEERGAAFAAEGDGVLIAL